MYNWTKTDPSKLPSKQAQEVWKLEQLINYGLNGEKISRKLLQKHFDTIHIDKNAKKLFALLLWNHKASPRNNN
ncbi:MAG: hypothetical protein H6774_00045 [Pseudomonadales bacterium]|nr:hypothetical protein [Candidatus Woesebacteria bacterium]MCB9801466.1 hypothetical protein [Pseudomonadales bacterium]